MPMAGALVAACSLPWLVPAGDRRALLGDLLSPLPGVLGDDTPAGNTVVLAADGSLITCFYRNNRAPVAADRISEVMKQALVDIEDSRFYEHHGLDVEGTARALVRNLVAGSGAWRAAPRSPSSWSSRPCCRRPRPPRSARPPPRTASAASSARPGWRWPWSSSTRRTEILTRYLNLVYFGQGAYGVQAAARRYFSVNAADLTLPQAAMLAGLVQTPSERRPHHRPGAAHWCAATRCCSGCSPSATSPTQEVAAIAPQPVAVAPRPPPPNGCVDASSAAFFCDFLQRYLTRTLGHHPGAAGERRPDHPDDAAPRPAGVRRPGGAATTWPWATRWPAMFTAVEPGTGHVLAMSVNRRFGYDAERPGAGVGQPQRGGQPGRGLDLQGLRRGRGAGARHPALERDHHQRPVRLPGLQERRPGGPTPSRTPGSYPPTLTMVEALVPLVEHLLRRAGGPARQRRGPGAHGPADGAVLPRPGGRPGDRGEPRLVHPRRRRRPARSALASAYSTLAANGTQCDPTPVTEILDRTGEPLTGADGAPLDTGDHCTPEAVPPAVATTLNQILRRRHGARRSAPAPGPPSRATRSPARPAPARTASPWPSSATRRSTRRASWCSTPSRTRTSAAYGGRRRRTDLARRDAADPLGPGSRRSFPPAGLPLQTRPAPAAPAGLAGPRPPRSPPAAPDAPEDCRWTEVRGRACRQLSGHQFGGPLAQHHRGRGGPARGTPRHDRGVHDPQPGRRRATRSSWSTTAPRVGVRTHPRGAGTGGRGGQVRRGPSRPAPASSSSTSSGRSVRAATSGQRPAPAAARPPAGRPPAAAAGRPSSVR